MNDPWEADLLRHERFLLRLATRLAGSEVEAEDLVQDAFVRALERPPRASSGDGSLRAWLATVLRRSAGRAARSARRRTEREARAAASEEREDHASIEARLDAHAELLALLRDLPEGERRVLYLRYAEDLAPPAIAARLGVPLETARTRLRRGRERLRAQLDEHHGGRAAWAALLLPATSPLHPTVAPAPAAHAATSPAAHAATSPAAHAATSIATGVLMGTTAKIFLCVGACTASLLLWLHKDGEPASPAVARTPQIPAEAPALADELRGAANAANAAPGLRTLAAEPAPSVLDPASFAPEEPAPDPSPWPLIVRASGPDAAWAAGADLRVWARLDAFRPPGARAIEATLDANGEALLDVGPHLAQLLAQAGGARAEELIVELDHPDLVPAEGSLLLPDPLDLAVAPREPLLVVVPVARAAIVVGRVVGVAGAPPEGPTSVQAHARTGDAIERDPAGHVEPGEDGVFRLRVDGAGPFALLAVGVRDRPATALPVLARGGVVDVGDLVLGEGVAIDGRAVDLAGAPTEHANVFAMLLGATTLVDLAEFSFDLPGTLAWHAGAFELFGAQAKTAADGAFRMTGLGPHRYQLDTQAPDVEVPFALADKLETQAPATVEIRPQAAELRLVFQLPSDAFPYGVGTWTRAGRDEHFEMPGWQLGQELVRRYALPPHERFRLVLDFDGLAPVELEVETPGVGALVEREVRLEPDAGAARVVLALRGEPVADGTPFVAVLDSGGRVRERELATSRGELVLDDLTPGPLALVLTAGEDRFAPLDHLRTVELDLVLAPGERRRIDVELERGGALTLEALSPAGERLYARCTVFTAAGDELDLAFVARLPHGRVAGHGLLFPGGPSRAVPELPAGRYRAAITAEGYEPLEIELAIRAGATTERAVTLRPVR